MITDKVDISTIEGRIYIINEIIKKIASLDRKFFEHNGRIWHIFNLNVKLFIRSGYSGFDINLCDEDGSKPYGFTYGGTIWALVKDFKEFILTGNKSNGENGYGGLFCSHWGYSKESMEEIRETAKALGYL